MFGNPTKQEYENLKSQLESEKEKRIRLEVQNEFLEKQIEELRTELRESHERENQALAANMDAKEKEPDIFAEITRLEMLINRPVVGSQGIATRKLQRQRLSDLKEEAEITQKQQQREAALTDLEKAALEKALEGYK